MSENQPILHSDDFDVKRESTVEEIQQKRMHEIRSESAAIRNKIASRGFLAEQLQRTSVVPTIFEARKRILERTSQNSSPLKNS